MPPHLQHLRPLHEVTAAQRYDDSFTNAPTCDCSKLQQRSPQGDDTDPENVEIPMPGVWLFEYNSPMPKIGTIDHELAKKIKNVIHESKLSSHGENIGAPLNVFHYPVAFGAAETFRPRPSYGSPSHQTPEEHEMIMKPAPPPSRPKHHKFRPKFDDEEVLGNPLARPGRPGDGSLLKAVLSIPELVGSALNIPSPVNNEDPRPNPLKGVANFLDYAQSHLKK